MKLSFDKDKDEKITVLVSGKNFATKDYILMIKEIKGGNNIEVEYGSKITTEEQKSINAMIDDINAIKKEDEDDEDEEETDEDSDF